ncbi:MAG: extracellular solute-binding protein [Caldilinea sp.]|jgi:multiple sugar transport system substrate-binding protein|nr:extracellular solute-binding protein [Caldilinea sp.]
MSVQSRVSRRQFLKAAAGSAALLGLAGCVAPVAPAGSSAPAAAVDSIRVLVVGDPFQFALEKIVGNFAEQSGVQVNLESLSYDALNARLATSFVSGASDADVVTVDQMWNSQYYDNQWIVALDDYIAADNATNLGDFIPEVLHSLNTWRGHIVTLPIASYAQGVMYRTDVYESLGLAAPPKTAAEAGDWTWDAYLEQIGQLDGQDVNGTTLHGTVICGAQPVPVVHMYSQLGASYGARWFQQFPEAPWDFTPTINSPENIAGLAAYKQLYDRSPDEAINYVWFDAGTRFSQGDIGAFFWWTPYFYLIKNNGYMTGELSTIVENYDVGMLPHAAGRAPLVSLGGWSLGMPSSTDKKDAAWQFIQWATGAEAQKQMALVPDYNYQFSDFGRRSLYADADLRAIYPYLDVQLELMGQGNGKLVRPPMPIYTSLEAVYGLNINQVLSGGLTPEQGLATTDTLFRNVLQGNFMLPYQFESYNDTPESTQELIARLAG